MDTKTKFRLSRITTPQETNFSCSTRRCCPLTSLCTHTHYDSNLFSHSFFNAACLVPFARLSHCGCLSAPWRLQARGEPCQLQRPSGGRLEGRHRMYSCPRVCTLRRGSARRRHHCGCGEWPCGVPCPRTACRCEEERGGECMCC